MPVALRRHPVAEGNGTDDRTGVVLYEVDGKIGIITLNRPKQPQRRSTRKMRSELAAKPTLCGLTKNPAVAVVVLRGAGRSFCAGL